MDPSAVPRVVELGYEEPEDFDAAALERVLVSLHGVCPLVAVLFQDGNWFDGEPLAALDDEALVRRLGVKKARRG